MVPISILRHGLGKRPLEVFIAMSKYADGTTRETWVTQETIAKDCGYVYRGKPDTGAVWKAQGQLRKRR